MKTSLLIATLIASFALCGWAQSAKVTAKTSALTLLPKTSGTGSWKTVLANQIKTSNQKDLFIGVSLECGLFTSTSVSSKNMIPDTSVGQAEIKARVLVDGKVAEPGVVTFGRRTQTLTAQLEGAIGSCLVAGTNLDGTTSVTVNTNCVSPETISLILDSSEASTFNFVAVDVPQGNHIVSVQCQIDTIGSATAGQYQALATVGKGSLTVESVRLVKDANVVLDVP